MQESFNSSHDGEYNIFIYNNIKHAYIVYFFH